MTNKYSPINLELKPLCEGENPPTSILERKVVNVNGRKEHEDLLRDSKKMWNLGLDPYYEKITYLNRWGSWLNGSKSNDGKLSD